jgi:hypothetical protein
VKILGPSARSRLESRNHGSRVWGFGIAADQLHEESHTVARIGLERMLPECQLASLILAIFQVVKVQEGPGGFRDHAIQPEGFQPAFLSVIVALTTVKRLALGKFSSGGEWGVVRPEPGKVFESSRCLWTRLFQSELGRHQPGKGVVRVDSKVRFNLG